MLNTGLISANLHWIVTVVTCGNTEVQVCYWVSVLMSGVSELHINNTCIEKSQVSLKPTREEYFCYRKWQNKSF